MTNKFRAYTIECDWCTKNEKPDTSGSTQNGWNGIILVRENDGYLFGVVTDYNASSFTHFVQGSFANDIGISLIKFNVQDTRYDPISFTGVVNDNNPSLTGTFSALTPYNTYEMGYCQIYITPTKLTQKEQDKFNENVKFSRDVLEDDPFAKHLSEITGTNGNHKEIIEKLKRILAFKLSNPYNFSYKK